MCILKEYDENALAASLLDKLRFRCSFSVTQDDPDHCSATKAVRDRVTDYMGTLNEAVGKVAGQMDNTIEWKDQVIPAFSAVPFMEGNYRLFLALEGTQ